MRLEFANHILKIAEENNKIVFLTGDLGFMAFEKLKWNLKDRFINTGVSEQNMISIAASLAYEGLIPFCYSIAPFIVFRPAEQIRIDVCLHNLNVKIVGNGGGFGYGIMGSTHHAIEDIAVMSSFQNMTCYIPFCNEDTIGSIDSMMKNNGPSYLRLGFGIKPSDIPLPPFNAIRQLLRGNKITIAGFGPILINVFKALTNLGKDVADVFAVSEMPLTSISNNFIESLKKTGKLLVIEEHVRRGGLGENMADLLIETGLICKYSHLYIRGYSNGLYGNQEYHLEVNGLSVNSILSEINKFING